MAEVIWTEPTLSDLDAIADYIALDNPEAAKSLVQNVFQHIGQLADHPGSGSKPQELKGWRYRQIIEPPCRIIYREEGSHVYILHVIRSEQMLRRSKLEKRSTRAKKHP